MAYIPLLLGESPALAGARRRLEQAAPSQASVLLTGETGTGKELAARLVHGRSLRADKPFVPVNCGALPEGLAESLLFGHRKGSFTGAVSDHVGHLLAADGGTLFLDEIGDLSLLMQVKLLRFLEGRRFYPVGAAEEVVSSVRLVCATNRNLRAEVEQSRFRSDLFYRISTFEVELPPLRERPGDLALLIPVLLRRVAGREPALTDAALRQLGRHSWPGNIRELANVLEHAAVLAGAGPIGLEHLPDSLGPAVLPNLEELLAPAAEETPPSLDEIKCRYVWRVLKSVQGDRVRASVLLRISLSTVYSYERRARALALVSP